jgi:hypothetical protein
VTDKVFKAHRSAALLLEIYFRGPIGIFKQKVEDSWIRDYVDYGPYYFTSGQLSDKIFMQRLNFKGLWVAHNLCIKHNVWNMSDWQAFYDIMP